MSPRGRNAELINENRGMKTMKSNRIENILKLDGAKQGTAKQSLLTDLVNIKSDLKVVGVRDPFSSSPTLDVVLTQGDISARVHIRKSAYEHIKKFGTKDMNVCGEGYYEGHKIGLSHINKIVAYQINKERFCGTVRDSAGDKDTKTNTTLKKLKINSEYIASHMTTKSRSSNGYGWEDTFKDSVGNNWNMSYKSDEMDFDIKDCYERYTCYNVFYTTLFENSEYRTEAVCEKSMSMVNTLFTLHRDVIAKAIMDARVQCDEDFISKRMYLIENSPVFDIADACAVAVNKNVRGAYAPNFTELDKIKQNTFILNQHASTVCFSPRNFRDNDFNYSSYEGEGDWEMRKLQNKFSEMTEERLIDDFIITGWGQPEKTSIKFMFGMHTCETTRYYVNSRDWNRPRVAFDIDVKWVEKTDKYGYRETASETKQRRQGWAVDYTPYDSHNGRNYVTHHAKTVIKKVIPNGMKKVFDNHERAIESARAIMIKNAELLMTENKGQTYIDNALLGSACVHSRDSKGLYSIYVDASGNLHPLTDEEVMSEYLSKETVRGERNNPINVRLLLIDTRDGDGDTASLKLLSDYGYDVNAEVLFVKDNDAIAYLDAMVKRLQDVDTLLGKDITIK